MTIFGGIITMAKQAESIIQIKLPLKWYYMSLVLETLRGDGIMSEKEYGEYFKPLENYVNNQLIIPEGLEIKDEYVVCECIATEDKKTRRL